MTRRTLVWLFVVGVVAILLGGAALIVNNSGGAPVTGRTGWIPPLTCDEHVGFPDPFAISQMGGTL